MSIEHKVEHAGSLPSGYKLLPGESLAQPVVSHSLRRMHTPPSSLEQMMRLTKVEDVHAIGSNGPSVASLAMELSVETPEHLKLYEVLFGRDSLRVAIDLIHSFPKLARSTTLVLAMLQGVTDNAAREEEPGRIIHESRDPDDEIARQLSEENGWGWPYYGTIDATPEFIRTLTAYCQLSEENFAFLTEPYIDRAGQEQTMSHALEMAIEWIERRLHESPDGLMEFHSLLPQVWKDSWDAYGHVDGTLANYRGGIASIEVQVTTYDALIDAAELLEDILDNPSRAQELRETADRLGEKILELFWCEDKGGYFVLGLDRDEAGTLRQMRVRTSNMGHALNSRLLIGAGSEIARKRDAVVTQLASAEMLNACGIRTLASDEVRYRPGAYHNGSVWLWDTHHIAKGLRRLGFREFADDLDARILNTVNATRMFPEYVRGDSVDAPLINHKTIILWDEVNQRLNKVEQPPQEVQAWTVAAILATKKRHGRSISARQ